MFDHMVVGKISLIQPLKKCILFADATFYEEWDIWHLRRC